MKSKYFRIEELVHPKDLEEYGEEKCWEFFDFRAIEVLDFIKYNFKDTKIYCNTWLWGGLKEDDGRIYDDRGYRGEHSDTKSANKSKHKIGRAFDLIFDGKKAEEIRNWLKNNQADLPHPIRIEGGVNWLHFDVDAKPGYKIYEFKV